MKKLIPLLIVCALLLVGCKKAGGFLGMPDSPSADLPERPGVVSESSREESAEESDSGEVPLADRNMTFLETEHPYLQQLLTRKGDLEVLDMTYGGGVYFAITKRESGIALTGYDQEGIGVFAGIMETDFESPELLGYADGYACLYSPVTYQTFACKADGTYAAYPREEADEVRLYPRGYVHIKGNTVSFYGPAQKKPYETHTMPSHLTYLFGNEEQMIASRTDGTLVYLTFDAETFFETELSPFLNCDGMALSFSSHEQTVIFNPYDHTLVSSSDHLRVLAAGNGYLITELAQELRFVRTADGASCVLPKKGVFRFGARTDGGFLFAMGDKWYLLDDEALQETITVLHRKERTDLLYTAAKTLCSSAVGNIRLAESGAPYSALPAVAGYSASRVSDYEALFDAAADLLSWSQNTTLDQSICVYLCDSVTQDLSPVPYTLFKDGGVTGVLLDVTDADYATHLEDILMQLQEEPQA